MIEDQISKKIIGCAIEVHRILGPGLLESAYQECLCHEFDKNRIRYIKEKPMPIVYKDIKLDHGYRMDLLVEHKVVVELKTVEKFCDAHFAQLLTYLRLGNFRLGLLLNFNGAIMKDGIKRIIN